MPRRVRLNETRANRVRLSAARWVVLSGLVLVWGIWAPQAFGQSRSPELETIVERGSRLMIAGEQVDVDAFAEVYRDRDFAPIWIGPDGRLTDAGEILLDQLEAVASDGLDPDHFHVSEIHALLAEQGPRLASALEFLLSHLLVHYATDVGAGRLDPRAVDSDLFVFPRRVVGVETLVDALRAPDLRGYLASLAPRSAAYHGLRRALVSLREIVARGGWSTIDDGAKLEFGTSGPRVSQLRARLVASGDFSGDDTGDVFDSVLDDGVRAFQRRHGLAIDGVVGPKTRAALNVSAADRVEQIILNMERLRWLPPEPGDPLVLVNIAGFDLNVISKGQTVLTMPVVVGRSYRQTPVLYSAIEYVEINPYWRVPPKIASNDLLPLIIADVAYLAAKGFTVLSDWGAGAHEVDPKTIDWGAFKSRAMPFQLRQKPGPANALGRYKFRFPNPYSVYLHDTPNRSLFESAQRTFSSGCIRLGNARGFAEFLLQDQPIWSPSALDSVEASGVNRSVRLLKPVPIIVTYATAWVDPGGAVQFRDDVYGRDAALAAFLGTREETQAPQIGQDGGHRL